eukprot:m.83367 g.83367  ORF g.83367 m.83367 type:complete len:431 (-) comp14654_c0_seq1:429-1721(-)
MNSTQASTPSAEDTERAAHHDAMAAQQQILLSYLKHKVSGAATSIKHPCYNGMGASPKAVFHDILTTADKADVDAIVSYLNALPTQRYSAALQYALEHRRAENKALKQLKQKGDPDAANGAKSSSSTSSIWQGLRPLSQQLKQALTDTCAWLNYQDQEQPPSPATFTTAPQQEHSSVCAMRQTSPSIQTSSTVVMERDAARVSPRNGQLVSADSLKRAQARLNTLSKHASKSEGRDQSSSSSSQGHDMQSYSLSLLKHRVKRGFEMTMDGGELPAKVAHGTLARQLPNSQYAEHQVWPMATPPPMISSMLTLFSPITGQAQQESLLRKADIMIDLEDQGSMEEACEIEEEVAHYESEDCLEPMEDERGPFVGIELLETIVLPNADSKNALTGHDDAEEVGVPFQQGWEQLVMELPAVQPYVFICPEDDTF